MNAPGVPPPLPDPGAAGRSLRRDEVALRLDRIAAEFAQLAQQRTDIRATLDGLAGALRAARQRDQALEAQMALLARRMSLLEPLAGPAHGRPAAAAAHPAIQTPPGRSLVLEHRGDERWPR